MQGTQDANAAAPQILKGYSAYVKGAKVNGSMPNNGAVSHSLAVNGSYTIPAGYHNGSGKVTQSLTTQGAQTITPGTTAKTIPAGRFLSGAQTIAGDANLVPANIAKGKTIFGVTGNFEGGNAKAGDLIVQSGSGTTCLQSNKTYNIGFKPSFLICYIFATYLSAAILCKKGSTYFQYGLLNGSATGSSAVYEQIELTDTGFKTSYYGSSFKATGSGSDFIAAKYIALP